MLYCVTPYHLAPLSSHCWNFVLIILMVFGPSNPISCICTLYVGLARFFIMRFNGIFSSKRRREVFRFCTESRLDDPLTFFWFGHEKPPLLDCHSAKTCLSSSGNDVMLDQGFSARARLYDFFTHLSQSFRLFNLQCGPGCLTFLFWFGGISTLRRTVVNAVVRR